MLFFSSLKIHFHRSSYILFLFSIALTFYLGIFIQCGLDCGELLLLVKNISEKSCLSYLADCSPTTTDLGPVYPLVVSIIFYLGGQLLSHVVLVQSISLILLSILIAIHFVKYYSTKYFSKWFVCSFVLLNPFLVGWNRTVHPDLFVYLVTLILVLLLDEYCHNKKYISIFLYSILVGFGSLLRYEFILFSVPIFAYTILTPFNYFKKPRKRLKVISVFLFCFLICLIPLSLWAYRNYSLGLPLVRENYFGISKLNYPIIENWIKSWTINQWDYQNGLWQYLTGNFADIQPPSWATNDKIQDRLSSLSEIDAETLSLIKNKTNSINANIFIVGLRIVKKIIWMIFNPFWSAGFGGLWNNQSTLLETVAYFFSKIYSLFGRLISLFLGYFSINSLFNKQKLYVRRNFAVGIFLTFASYIFITIWLCQLETRYLTAPFLAILMFSIFSLCDVMQACRDTSDSASN